MIKYAIKHIKTGEYLDKHDMHTILIEDACFEDTFERSEYIRKEIDVEDEYKTVAVEVLAVEITYKEVE